MVRRSAKNTIKQEFLKQLNKKSLDRITVKSIIQECGLNRNTFYYYYSGIDELITEILSEAADQAIGIYTKTGSWVDGFGEVARYTLANKTAVSHIFHSSYSDHLRAYINKISGYMIKGTVNKLNADIKADSQNVSIVRSFFQYAFSCLYIEWIKGGYTVDPYDYLRRAKALFSDCMINALKRGVALDLQ